MTQKISSNRFTPALNMFFFTLRKSLGFTAVATVLALILSPFYISALFCTLSVKVQTLTNNYSL